MSTKVTIAFANREMHGEDFHLYFDYADMDIHLEINGKEVSLPTRLKEWIYTMWELSKSVTYIHWLVDRIDRGEYLLPLGAGAKNANPDNPRSKGQ